MSGRLIYLIGPSGSGKDSLLDAARTRLAERGCRIVRRVITRSAEAVGEAALGVSMQQFAEMQAQGAFALSWQANGLAYGIPREIDEWLATGTTCWSTVHASICRKPVSVIRTCWWCC